MSTLQNTGILLGAVGGVITIYKFVQEQLDRYRKNAREGEDSAFIAWATAYEVSLGGGDGCSVLEVPEGQMSYAARAVREGRLAWTGFPRMIALPARASVA